MSNKYAWHLRILPEDDAYRMIANGFKRALPQEAQRKIDIRPVAGGWKHALELIPEQEMEALPQRHLLVLTDFDSAGDVRVDYVSKLIAASPSHDRVFSLGPKSEAEDLKGSLSAQLKTPLTPEACGEQFASDGLNCPDALWRNEQLDTAWNRENLSRLCPILRKNLGDK